MAIGDQFSGLDMKNLIGAPLSAAADASVELANSTADFINKVGFDQEGKIRTAQFKFNQKTLNEDGTADNNQMNVDVPLLAIVPIPNLQIDEVNVLFDMEVKQSESSEANRDYAGSFSTTANFGIIKATVSGSVSAHESNTRSSDNSAKYHVDVSATNHGTPEGLARVLDMMAANVAPSLAASTAVDETGKALAGEKKAKNDKLKELRAKKTAAERACTAADKIFMSALTVFKKEGSNKLNKYSLILNGLINQEHSQQTPDEAKIQNYTQLQQKLNNDWTQFQNSAKDTVNTVAAAVQPGAEGQPAQSTPLLQAFSLSAVNAQGELIGLAADASEFTQLTAYYNAAVAAAKKLEECSAGLNQLDVEYNNVLMGI